MCEHVGSVPNCYQETSFIPVSPVCPIKVTETLGQQTNNASNPSDDGGSDHSQVSPVTNKIFLYEYYSRPPGLPIPGNDTKHHEEVRSRYMGLGLLHTLYEMPASANEKQGPANEKAVSNVGLLDSNVMSGPGYPMWDCRVCNVTMVTWPSLSQSSPGRNLQENMKLYPSRMTLIIVTLENHC